MKTGNLLPGGLPLPTSLRLQAGICSSSSWRKDLLSSEGDKGRRKQVAVCSKKKALNVHLFLIQRSTVLLCVFACQIERVEIGQGRGCSSMGHLINKHNPLRIRQCVPRFGAVLHCSLQASPQKSGRDPWGTCWNSVA